MNRTVFTIIIVAAATLLALLGKALPLDRLHDYMLVQSFFESMIPLLAVGALVKYLMSWEK